MSKTSNPALAAVVACALCGSAALAAGSIDGEIGAVYWANEIETEGLTPMTTDADAPGFRAELWMLERYGVKAMQFGSDPDAGGIDGADTTSVDLMWRAWSPTENNFVAVGLGWGQMDLAPLGSNDSTSGARLSVEGRAGIAGQLFAYGSGAYLPALSDVDSAAIVGGRIEDLSGYELELGLSWRLAPFMSMRAGWRVNDMSFSEYSPESMGSGPLLAGGPIGRSGGNIVPLAIAPASPTLGVPMTPSSNIDGSIASSGIFVGLGFHF